MRKTRVDFFDKDGQLVELVHNNEQFTLEEVLKLNDIPEISAVINPDSENAGRHEARFLYNTIFKKVRGISVERRTAKAKASSPTFYTKTFIGFADDGKLVKYVIDMDRENYSAYVEQQFRSYIKRERIIENRDSLLLGFSGGIDSSVLLHLMMKKSLTFQRLR